VTIPELFHTASIHNPDAYVIKITPLITASGVYKKGNTAMIMLYRSSRKEGQLTSEAYGRHG
jgi:hypothetical protein